MKAIPRRRITGGRLYSFAQIFVQLLGAGAFAGRRKASNNDELFEG